MHGKYIYVDISMWGRGLRLQKVKQSKVIASRYVEPALADNASLTYVNICKYM